MKTRYSATLLALALLLAALCRPATSSAADSAPQLTADGLRPPVPPPTTAALDSSSPSRYQPSAFMAGRIAVQVIFVESDGSREPSTHDWSDAQIASTQAQIATALDWWRAHLPAAHLSFDITSQVVATGYEPVTHGLDTEGQWIGAALTHMGLRGPTYFEQAYAADERLRQERHTDWATTIFVANSAGTPGGRFTDGQFAYAYVGGPFLVVTSDAGPYGAGQMAPVITHEFGHIFGALDQYAAAGTPCTERSGYLAVATSNSEANNCGTRLSSIMRDPLSAYPLGAIDPSALGQIGYRDSDGDGLIDPLDTTPAIDLTVEQPVGGGRPTVAGRAVDQPYTPPAGDPLTINTVARVEYRADGGAWAALPPEDGAYDSSAESVRTSLPLYDGQHIVELRAINSVGGISPITTASLTISGAGAEPPYQASAPAMTNSAAISIGLSAPDGASAQISENPFFASAAWAPVTPTTLWQISGGDGTHTLYIRFRDANGVESPTFTRVVLLDRTPPTGRAILRARPAAAIEIQASDDGSGVAAVQVGAADMAAGEWQAFQTSLPLPAIGPQSSGLQVRLRDAAGNVSDLLPVVSAGQVYLPLAIR